MIKNTFDLLDITCLDTTQAISIIECDLNVDFATPIGYEAPTKQAAPAEEEEPAPLIVDSAFTPFAGNILSSPILSNILSSTILSLCNVRLYLNCASATINFMIFDQFC